MVTRTGSISDQLPTINSNRFTPIAVIIVAASGATIIQLKRIQLSAGQRFGAAPIAPWKYCKLGAHLDSGWSRHRPVGLQRVRRRGRQQPPVILLIVHIDSYPNSEKLCGITDYAVAGYSSSPET
ncbi:hypothetical protein [Nocardia sp. NPDC051832]|uniref:hypothetical protein n=1 Tax=Nocardia sp. NPDC051832 TaxID=3155673 RepID=UPI00342CCA51